MSVFAEAVQPSFEDMPVAQMQPDDVQGQLVGHSIFCVYDLLLGHVNKVDVEAVYLSRSVLERLNTCDLETRVRVAGIKVPTYLMDEEQQDMVRAAYHADNRLKENRVKGGLPPEPDNALPLYDLVAEMWEARLIRARPAEWGPVGKAYWMRNDEPVVMPWGDARYTTEPALI